MARNTSSKRSISLTKEQWDILARVLKDNYGISDEDGALLEDNAIAAAVKAITGEDLESEQDVGDPDESRGADDSENEDEVDKENEATP